MAVLEPSPPPPPLWQPLPQRLNHRPSATTYSQPSHDSFRRLGKHIKRLTQIFLSGGWEHLVHTVRGPSKLSNKIRNLPHPAAALLTQLLRAGAPAKHSGHPWSESQVRQAMERGCHQSAVLHSEFLYEELADMIEKGQWLVLPFKLVQTSTQSTSQPHRCHSPA